MGIHKDDAQSGATQTAVPTQPIPPRMTNFVLAVQINNTNANNVPSFMERPREGGSWMRAAAATKSIGIALKALKHYSETIYQRG
jgi:hypothetical protein